MAAEIARSSGREEDAKTLNSAADEIVDRLDCPDEDLGRSLSQAITNRNDQEIQRIRNKAHSQGSRLLEAYALIIQGTEDKNIPRGIKSIEAALKIFRSSAGKNADIAEALVALGTKILRAGELRRALPHFREALKHDPLNWMARQNFGAILWELKEWNEAATFFSDQRKRFGDRPTLLYAHGRSLVEKGDFSGALRPLYAARNLLVSTDDLYPHIVEYLDRAMASGAQLSPPPSDAKLVDVSRVELESCLDAFSQYIAAEKRMSFWSSGKNGKKTKSVSKNEERSWISSPEKYAQDLLHTYINAHFGDRVEIFEELHIGAGRLDLYVVTTGGLKAILELKMVGGRYSSTYAFNGVDQITHYMEQKRCYLGYLLAFDGRERDFKKGIPSSNLIDKCTVYCRFVDVRASSPSKK